MSDTTMISTGTFKVEDFVSVDHGTNNITLTIFKHGPLWRPVANHYVELSADQATELGKELIRRADLMVDISDVPF